MIGGLEPDPASGQLRAVIAQPVERNGQVLMNLSLTLLPQELQQIIDAQKMPADWTATIMDASGTVVARHPGGTRLCRPPCHTGPAAAHGGAPRVGV